MTINELSPLEKVLSRLQGVKQSRIAGYYTALCPIHGDRQSSLQISERTDGSVGIFCHAGCTPKGDKGRLDAMLQALDLKHSDLFIAGREREQKEEEEAREEVTIESICTEKILNFKVLLNLFGVEEVKFQGRTALKIPYYDENGVMHPRYRRRLTLSKAGQRFNWGGELGVPPIAYGLHLLNKAREAGFLVLVEGETDTWTCVQHRIPALGLPGASQPDKLLPEYLANIDKLYIVDEGGKGGTSFVTGLQTRLEGIGYEGVVRIVEIGKSYRGCKDPNDLNVRLWEEGRLDDFHAEFTDLLEASILLEDWQESGDELAPRTVSIDFVMNMPPARWLVGGMLPEGGLAMLLAQENTGKSFVAIDWACSVATGLDWMDRPVQQGKVVYAAAEGLPGHAKRLRAWLAHKGMKHYDALKQNMRYVAGIVDLFDTERRVQFTDMAIAEAPALLIIDTLAESMPGADENTSKDMGVFLAVARHIRKETGACVLVLHHKPKSGNGSRGHSSLPGALDMSFELSIPDENDRSIIDLWTVKSRDVIKPTEPLKIKMLQIMLSEAEYDNSAVLLPADRVLASNDPNGMSIMEKKVYDLLTKHGRITSEILKMQADNIGIKRSSFHNYINGLCDKGFCTKQREGKNTYYEAVPVPA